MKPLCLFILTAAALSSPVCASAQSSFDFDDVAQTMVTLERAFESQDTRALEFLSSSRFKGTEFFSVLSQWMTCCRVNSAYATRTAKQRFTATNKDIQLTF